MLANLAVSFFKNIVRIPMVVTKRFRYKLSLVIIRKGKVLAVNLMKKINIF